MSFEASDESKAQLVDQRIAFSDDWLGDPSELSAASLQGRPQPRDAVENRPVTPSRATTVENIRKRARHNVLLALVVTLIVQTSQGVWGYAVLGPYIENLTHSNSKVGYAEGIQGIFKAVLAIPAGYAADRWSRSKVIRLGTFLGALAGAMTLLALFMGGSDMKQYGLLTAALAFWGAFDGAITSPMQALYADSVPLGQRDVAFMRLFAAQIIGTSAGPIVNTILFAELGNDWSQSQLRVVFTVGIFVGVPGYLLLSCFRDLKQSNQRQQQQLEEDQRPVRLIGSSPGKVMAPVGSIQEVSASQLSVVQQSAIAGGSSLQTPLLAAEETTAGLGSSWPPEYAEDRQPQVWQGPGSGPRAFSPSSSSMWSNSDGDDDDDDDDNDHRDQKLEHDADDDVEHMLQSNAHPDIREGGPGAMVFGRRWKWLTVDKIPLITAIGDVTFGIASGMTIKFFPLWFKNECEMRPVTVNTIYVLMPLCLVAMTYAAQWVSRWMGRAQVSVWSHYLGVALLVVMVILEPWWTKAWVIVPVYLLRTALMNCGYPLVKSILMDSVTSQQRAKWNSLESVSSFGWSGSAALGGILLDNFGYEVTLTATAVLQFLATVWTMLLLPLVPKKQWSPDQDEEVQDTTRSIRQDNCEMQPMSPGHQQNHDSRKQELFGLRSGDEAAVLPL